VMPDYRPLLEIVESCGLQSVDQTPAPGTVFTGDETGDHNVAFVVTDLHGNIGECNMMVTVTDNEAFDIVAVIKEDVQCFEADNGNIIIFTTGGQSIKYFSIDGIDYSNTSGAFYGLAPGTYSVSAKSAHDCLEVWGDDVIITQPDLLVIDSVDYENVSYCYGMDNASITVYAHGGTQDYLYSADGGQSYQWSNYIEELTAGEYHVQVSDANSCLAIWDPTIIITDPDELVLLDVQEVDIHDCYGDDSGEIHISAMGGTDYIRYSIDDGDTWQINDGDYYNLSAGTYLVKIKDANGCYVVYDSPVVIDEMPEYMITDIIVNHVLDCYGDNSGSIEILLIGGTGTISYSIDGGQSFIDNNGLFENLGAGAYDVFMKDEHDCLYEYTSNPVVINQPSQIAVSVNATDVTVCADDNNGAISITALGGYPDYTYSIDAGTTWSASGDFENLFAGEYYILVKDAHACIMPYYEYPMTLGAPESVVFQEVIVQDITCINANNASIEIIAAGGAGNYTYSIDLWETSSTSNTFTYLGEGNYYLSIKDELGCDVYYQDNPVVIQNPAPVVIEDVAIQDVSCPGDSDGEIVITATGGTGELIYSLDGGQNYTSDNIFTNLSPGAYLLLTKDANGCSFYYENNPVVVGNPDELIFTNVIADDGPCIQSAIKTIEVFADGGTGDVSYSIDNGVTYQESNFFTDVPIGDAYLFIKDGNGCVSEYENNPLVFYEYHELNLDVTIHDVELCYGDDSGEIHIEATGGNGPFTFSIDQGENWLDNNGVFQNLLAGSYDVLIKDGYGCVFEYENNSVEVQQPDQLMVTDIGGYLAVDCYGGSSASILITSMGGTGTILYSIDGGVTYVDNAGIFQNLIIGDYDVMLMDDNGCTYTYAENPIVITQPQEISFTFETRDNSGCYGQGNGFIIFDATSGGIGDYTYSIDGGFSYSSDVEFDELDAGLYQLVVKDANGCELPYVNNPVRIEQIDGLVITDVIIGDETCVELGIITIETDAIDSDILYSVDNGESYQDSNIFGDLVAGEYNIEIRDTNNCIILYEHNPVIVGPANTVHVTIISESGVDGCVGSQIQLQTHADDVVNYLWSTGETGSTITVLETVEGLYDYTCMVDDTEGCEGVGTITIDYHSLPTVDVVVESDDEDKFCMNKPISISAYSDDA
ncbi:MAG: SprB repeat-containing protein, partial [Chlamydiia bacterium]|nr:SprB repeat-containing protein [Chlamydiia bacterium]